MAKTNYSRLCAKKKCILTSLWARALRLQGWTTSSTFIQEAADDFLAHINDEDDRIEAIDFRNSIELATLEEMPVHRALVLLEHRI